MSEKRNKGIFYYFTLNLATIQGRVTLPFVLIIVVAMGLLYGMDYFWRSVNTNKDRIIEQIKPLALESIVLSNLIHKSQNSLNQYILLKESANELTNKELWLMNIPKQKDILKGVINQLSINEARIIFDRLNKQLGELRQLQQKTIIDYDKRRNDKIARYQIKNDLNSTLREVEKSLEDLIALSHDREAVILTNLNDNQIVFYRILGLAFVSGFIICYLIGLQMFAGIFSWIRELRDKYRDMSYGNLPDSFPEKHNEFKNLANHSNLLLDNLKALRNYAIEVGKGNFSSQTKIFGANSTLGRSLTEMGVSLQKVYDEERTRNWVTEGLAEFGEILRENTNDIDKLCRELISNLVRHLEAIQGGFFIINRDNEELFFELKAAFAYGKQRVSEKKIGINEGLLGRVYNEHEKVYLKQLPSNYVEVTSGLGATKPNTLILLPLMNEEGDIQGAVELTSFSEFEEYEVDFLEKLCASIASTITVVMATQKNQKLLEESQKIAETLRLREEDARLTAIEISKMREDAEWELRNIRHKYEKLKAVLDNSPEAVIIFNLNRRIEFFNPIAEKMFGYEEAEILGRNLKMIFTLAYNQEEEADTLVAERVLKQTQKVEAKCKNGTKILITSILTELEVNDEKLYVTYIKEA